MAFTPCGCWFRKPCPLPSPPLTWLPGWKPSVGFGKHWLQVWYRGPTRTQADRQPPSWLLLSTPVLTVSGESVNGCGTVMEGVLAHTRTSPLLGCCRDTFKHALHRFLHWTVTLRRVSEQSRMPSSLKRIYLKIKLNRNKMKETNERY